MTRKEFILQALIHRNTEIRLVEIQADILEREGYLETEEPVVKLREIPHISLDTSGLKISVRTSCTLNKLGVKTIRDLYYTSVDEIIKCRNAGKGVKDEILQLKGEIEKRYITQ